MLALAIACSVATGCVGGVFFAFTAFVMPALNRLPAHAGIAYLAGTVGVTVIGNVPLNNRLAATRPDTADAAGRWTRFASPWTRLNSVRTVASLAAAMLFALAAARV